MPLYFFHLAVPAPPEVVAERLHLLVRAVRCFWKGIRFSWKRSDPPGPLFIGGRLAIGKTWRR